MTLISMQWREHAACVGNFDLFFEDHKRTVVNKAKAFCKTCPVRLECLEHAIKNDERGIWGGMTANERRKLIRKLKLDAVPE